MNQKHTSQDVAQTIKNLFKQSGKQLNDFARDNGVTPTQLYAVLSGDKYINAAWAIKFNMEVGVEIMYCMFGDMPIMDSKHEFDKLLFAVTSYKEAVEAETKQKAVVKAFTGYTDTAVIAGRLHNTECMSYGPGSLQYAHKPDEFVEIRDIIRCEKVMNHLVMSLCEER